MGSDLEILDLKDLYSHTPHCQYYLNRQLQSDKTQILPLFVLLMQHNDKYDVYTKIIAICIAFP